MIPRHTARWANGQTRRLLACITCIALDVHEDGRSKTDTQCDARSRALAMALHPRLGADSPAQVLSADLMRVSPTTRGS
jgi:hypothetical protein